MGRTFSAVPQRDSSIDVWASAVGSACQCHRVPLQFCIESLVHDLEVIGEPSKIAVVNACHAKFSRPGDLEMRAACGWIICLVNGCHGPPTKIAVAGLEPGAWSNMSASGKKNMDGILRSVAAGAKTAHSREGTVSLLHQQAWIRGDD
jgi:hypothetical protein